MVVVDIVVGLALTYALFSLLCTSIVEWIARMLEQRSTKLKAFLQGLLQDPNIWKEFQDHPCIRELSKGGGFPSYIPEKTFALVLLNLTVKVSKGPSQRVVVRNDINSERLSQLLATILTGADNVSHALERIQQWYVEAGQRLTGQYTRTAHSLALIVAIVMTLALNIDSLRIAETLKTDRDLRARVSAQAQNQESASLLQRLDALSLPIGWQGDPFGWGYLDFLRKLVGWSVSILAIQLGAPFWFDLLSQFVNVRQTTAPAKT